MRSGGTWSSRVARCRDSDRFKLLSLASCRCLLVASSFSLTLDSTSLRKRDSSCVEEVKRERERVREREKED
jgi:hypothetical protein